MSAQIALISFQTGSGSYPSMVVFQIDDKTYEYEVPSPYFVDEIRRMARRQPGKALNLAKKVSA
jgi:hypothetical protein